MRSVAISADGEHLAAGSYAETKVYLFNKDNSTPLWSYATGGNVGPVTISADGEYLAAGSEDDKVYLFDKDSSTPLWSYTAGGNVRSVAVSADGEYLAVGSLDDKVYLFDKDSSTPLWNYTTGENVLTVTISADGEYLTAGSEDNKVYLFDKNSSTLLWSYTAGGNVYSVAISADGEYLAAGSDDDKVYAFENALPSRPSVIPYGPRNGTTLELPVTLRWFAGSDDRSNLTFDIYLDTSANPITKVADNITQFSYNVTSLVSKGVNYWKVVARDSTGETFSQVLNFTTPANIIPNAAINSISLSSANEGDNVSFKGSGTDNDGSIVAYQWRSSIDGDLSASAAFNTSALTWGNHTIYFKVQDNDGNWSSEVWQSLLVNVFPQLSNGQVVPTTGGESTLFSFVVDYYDVDGDGDQTVQVSIAGVGTFDMVDPDDDGTHYYNSTLSHGHHNFTFIATDEHGANATTDEYELLVNTLPTASIDSILPSPANEGDEVSFNGSGSDVDGTIVGYEWLSSLDGNLSTEASFLISSLSVGEHTISFRVQDNDGAWSDWNTTFLIVMPSDNSRPIASIVSISPSPANESDEVTFSGSGSDVDGTIVRYAWISNIDGEFYNGSNPTTTKSNLQRGDHNIYLKVQDNDGAWSEWNVTTLIILSANTRPTASIDPISPSPANEGDEVTFSGSGSDDGTIVAYEWDFDDDGNADYTSSTSAATNHVFNTSGTYIVRFRVLDDGGAWSDWDTIMVLVVPAESDDSTGISALISDVPTNVLFGALGLLLFVLIIGAAMALRRRRPDTETPTGGPPSPRRGAPPAPAPVKVTVADWQPPAGLAGDDLVLTDYFALRRRAYLAHPANEPLLDELHNRREEFAISSYFEVPASPADVLQQWALPSGLRGNVHLDAARTGIVEGILTGAPDRNFVIIGEPGVGKTVVLFEVLDRVMAQSPAGLLTTTAIGDAHVRFGLRLFYDDIPENSALVEAVAARQAGGLIVTAREADWQALPREFQAKFDRLTVPLFPAAEMHPLCEKMLAFSGVGYDAPAVEALVTYAEGSPIYVWSMIRELLHKGQRQLSQQYIQQNATKGMTNYVALLLQRLLKDGEKYRPGGLHALTCLVFLADYMEERTAHSAYFHTVTTRLSEPVHAALGDEMDQTTFLRILGYLSGEGEVVRFPHDTWVDVLRGAGALNPFRAELQVIQREFIDTGLFDSQKQQAVPDAWETIKNRYRKYPTRQKDSFLALADTLLRNFNISGLKELGIDTGFIREVAARYSHLPVAAMLISKLQAAEPTQVTNVINIQDSVISRSSIGSSGSASLNESIVNRSNLGNSQNNNTADDDTVVSRNKRRVKRPRQRGE